MSESLGLRLGAGARDDIRPRDNGLSVRDPDHRQSVRMEQFLYTSKRARLANGRGWAPIVEFFSNPRLHLFQVARSTSAEPGDRSVPKLCCNSNRFRPFAVRPLQRTELPGAGIDVAVVAVILAPRDGGPPSQWPVRPNETPSLH